jgi:hypothetical protein
VLATRLDLQGGEVPELEAPRRLARRGGRRWDRESGGPRRRWFALVRSEEAPADPLVNGLANEIGCDARRLAVEDGAQGRRHRNRTDPPNLARDANPASPLETQRLQLPEIDPFGALLYRGREKEAQPIPVGSCGR